LALENFLNSQNYQYSANNLYAAPVNYALEGHNFLNIFLIGDAAGLASKTTGEGIAFALTSGKEIAKKILSPDYMTPELIKILKFKKRQENILKIFETLPFLQTTLFKIFIKLMRKKWFQMYFGN
jgi:geranylgeranyl reductase